MAGFNINTITLSGNLTRDPELRTLPSGTAVCNLRIANNTRRKEGDEWVDHPNYFNVTVWSGIGEWVAANLSKGDRIVVSGRIEHRQYEDKEGNKREAYDVTAEGLVTPDSSGGGSRSSGGSDVPADTSGLGKEEPVSSGPSPAGVYGADDDIPF